LPELVAATAGHAFVLFTSYAFLKKVADSLRPLWQSEGYTMLVQGELPPQQLVRQFRNTPRSVLLGVDTFWQGIDIPGDALRNVIITRLPFAVPDRPLIEGTYLSGEYLSQETYMPANILGDPITRHIFPR
jgi:ATP-dependent DNA helicase DinG